MPRKMYGKKASVFFWGDQWDNESIESLYADVFNHIILKRMTEFMPREGVIIEGGCGLAQYVYALNKMGYNIKGIDYSEDTIKKNKSFDPGMPVEVGNVFNLNYEDESISGYISLGVVEHYEEGAERIIKEMRRVLKKDGTLCITVPYFNPVKKIKEKLKSRKNIEEVEGEFYQFIYEKDELIDIVQEDFDVIKVFYYNPVKGFTDEFPIFKKTVDKLTRSGQGGGKPNRDGNVSVKNQFISLNNMKSPLIEGMKIILSSDIVCRNIGHAIGVIARKH